MTDDKLKENFIKYFGEEKWDEETMLGRLFEFEQFICDYLDMELIPIIVEEMVDDAEEIDAETEALVETMKEELSVYADYLPAEEAAAAGMYTITADGVAGGQEEWDAFMAGEHESVILCQYTQKGGVVLDYLMHREDGSYLILSDSSRDGYEDDEKMGEDFEVQKFAALKVFEDFTVQEGGTAHTVCVMTNDAELDAATFLQYCKDLSYEENGVFMLFVI